MRAELASYVRFAVAGTTVHAITGAGERRPTSFDLDDGRHKIMVTATDTAGNTSRKSRFTVTVDTVGPDQPAVNIDTDSVAGGDTAIAVAGERAARYLVKLSGQQRNTESGTIAGQGEETVSWQLPNGDYTVKTVLADVEGNKSKATRRKFYVALPPPDEPRIGVNSKPGANPVEIDTTDDGAEAIEMKMLDGNVVAEETVELTASDEGSTSFDLPDGRYALEATGIDFQGQRSPIAREFNIVVDTAPPTVDIRINEQQLATGLFGFRLRTQEGASVRIDSETEALTQQLVASGAWHDFALDVPDGEHAITITALDEFGNEVTKQVSAEVTSPLGLVDWAILLVMAAAIVGSGFGIWKIVRRVRQSRRMFAAPAPSWPPQ